MAAESRGQRANATWSSSRRGTRSPSIDAFHSHEDDDSQLLPKGRGACSNCRMRDIICDGSTPCRACRQGRFCCEPTGAPLPSESLPFHTSFDQSFSHRSESPVPERLPFLGVTTIGTLFHANSRVRTKVDLYGIIDEDVSQNNGEWTCHRSDYLSCECSYSISPPANGDSIKLKPESSTRSYDVHGFAMSISAIESDCEPYESCVDIIQHVAYGVHGPSTRAPAKVQLRPRNITFMDAAITRTSHRFYPSEHTFYQLEVKTVTAGNGRQPDGQPYFQLVIELWADLGSQHPVRFVKVAYKKSATITLRGQRPRTVEVPLSSIQSQQAGLPFFHFNYSGMDSERTSHGESSSGSEWYAQQGDTQVSHDTQVTEPDVHISEWGGIPSQHKSGSPYYDRVFAPQGNTMPPFLKAGDERSSTDNVPKPPTTANVPKSSTTEAVPRSSTTEAPFSSTRRHQRPLSHRGLLSRLRKMFRPSLRPGYRRIEWTCDCGVDLYGDFSQGEPSDLDALEASLRSPAQNTPPESDSTDTEGVEETPRNSQLSDLSLWKAATTASPTLTDASSVELHSKFLALCVNVGGMYKKLAEIDTSRIASDSEVFSQMKKAYSEHRGLRSRLSLLIKPEKVEYVRFTLWNLRHGYISITDRPEATPPKTAVEYDFVPLLMPPEVFVHYLQHGDADLSPNRHTWLPCLPQRLNGEVLYCGEAAEGWGIHVVEGLNREAVFWIVMAAVLASLLTSVLWALLRGDIQGGVGLGALIAALLSVILTAFLFWLEAI